MYRLARAYSTVQNAVHLEKLTGRKLIKISGNEVGDYLQGLITNDVQHLDHGAGSMYSMFLNTKGRILYDTIVYKRDDSYLLECDVEALQPLEKHLKMFRVRRKIDIVNLQDDYDIFVLYNSDCTSCEATVPPCGKKEEGVTRSVGDIFIYRDPRIVQLGSRIIAPKNCDVEAEISKLTLLKPAATNYRKFRYSLGVGEGVNDLPPGDCFPLEANCDYLHGVSFHKGCYIGQELTARTYHTGVIRKRLMPLFLDKTIEFDSPKEIKIEHDSTNLGKLRGAENEVALGLIRVAQAIDVKNFKVGEATATTRKPIWWPIEAPKEKMTA